jgi:hypothetical protein
VLGLFRGTIFRSKKDVCALPDNLAFPVPKNALGAAIPVDDTTSGISQEDSVILDIVFDGPAVQIVRLRVGYSGINVRLRGSSIHLSSFS